MGLFKKPSGNGHVPSKPLPKQGPSKKTRDDYIRKVKEIIRKNPPPPKKPS